MPVSELEIMQLPVVRDPRGNLAFVQESALLKFPISDVAWIYDVPDMANRHGITGADSQAVIIALSGSFDVKVTTGDGSCRAATLRRSSQAVLVPPQAEWNISEFSTNSVGLVITSCTTKRWPATIAPSEIIGTEADPHLTSSVEKCRIMDLPAQQSSGGRTCESKNDAEALMNVKRVFYLFDVPSGATRGGHSHFIDQQFIVAVSGSFTVDVDDGTSRRTFVLNRPNQGLYIPAGIWRELRDFSTGSISMVLTSEPYQEDDYVREYDRFTSLTEAKKRTSQRIPTLDLKRENEVFGFDSICEAMSRVVHSGRYIGGDEVAHFEQKLAEITGTDYAVGVSTGLDALRLIFKAYIETGRLSPGDEVIVPANTYIASVLAVTDAGLIPIFCEPDPQTLNIDSSQIESLITPRTRAILTVHLYGRAAWDAEMLRIATAHHLLVVEDNAQAIGASAHAPGIGGSCLTGNLGHAAAFSFYPTKNIGAIGDAGAVTTNDARLAAVIRALANYGSCERYKNIYKGYNCRLDPVQAAVLSIKLDSLDRVVATRRHMAELYERLITNPAVEKPMRSEPDLSVWYQYVVRVANRDSFRRYLADNGIATDVHYPTPPHRQPCYKEFSHLRLPLTDLIAATCVSLPVGTLSDIEITRIARIINAYTC